MMVLMFTSSIFNEKQIFENDNSPAALQQSASTVVGRIGAHC
jgi:hypothetical protein